MKTPLRRRSAGFTLIELMAVITIIIILAGLVVGGMAFVSERQAKEKAKVQIALLSKAIEEYKLEMGSYPGTSSQFGGASATGKGGDYSQVLYAALYSEGLSYQNQSNPPANWSKATKIFLPELDPTTSKQGWTSTSETKIRDPWGNPYLYRVGTNAQNPDFDLWSKGKDGQTNTNDPSLEGTAGRYNRDDIRNF